MATIRSATLFDVEPLARTLARAFDQDPVINWLIREDHQRRKGFELLFRQSLRDLSLPFGMVLNTDDCTGVAIWIPSENTNLGFSTQLCLLPDIIRAASWKKLARFIKCMNILNVYHPHEKHYYLMFIGVDPAYRNHGIGAALIRPVLERCDKEGRSAYLENTNLANQRFYEQLGFKSTVEIPLGKSGPSVYTMWREPKK